MWQQDSHCMPSRDLGAGVLAAVAGYQLFSHIRVRVEAWQDPIASYGDSGYQVAQSLFAIGTGSWFGTGLFQGQPDTIPVSETDFIFSAITEEMGVIYALCLILICVSCYVMFLNIAMELHNYFYKLVALGLGDMLYFPGIPPDRRRDEIHTVHGNDPSLCQLRGSSVLSTMIMFGIIQGLYILREDEEEKLEQEKLKKERKSRNGMGRTAPRKAAKNDRDSRKSPDRGRAKSRERAQNKEFAWITYFFVILFIALMDTWSISRSRGQIPSSTARINQRQDAFAKKVVRGSITDRNGNVLAQTDVAEDGTETRVYPYGSLFAHVVGYSDTDLGKTGLESVENFELLTSNAFFVEKIQNEFNGTKNQGDTVVTTLDADLQQAAYEALGDNKGAVVVMEADTGKILTMVSKPDYDPNNIAADWEVLNTDEENSPLLNRATNGSYAPGSVFKIITTLAFMQQNSDYQSYTYDCTGSITVGNTTIPCFDNTVHGFEDLRSSFANSCNSSFANIGLSLDLAKYRETAEDLLFNSALPGVLDYTKSSFVLDEGSQVSEIMMTAMGQGRTTVSPYHMALITQAVANGGNAHGALPGRAGNKLYRHRSSQGMCRKATGGS